MPAVATRRRAGLTTSIDDSDRGGSMVAVHASPDSWRIRIVSHSRIVPILSILCLVVLTSPGCSPPTAPTEIKGMTPAEYREKQEQALGSPRDGSEAASKKARTSR